MQDLPNPDPAGQPSKPSALEGGAQTTERSPDQSAESTERGPAEYEATPRKGGTEYLAEGGTGTGRSDNSGAPEFSSVPWGAVPSRAHHELPQVPWTQRDVTWGAIWGVGLLLALSVVFTVTLSLTEAITGIDLPEAAGLVIILAELVLLLPVWWLGIRKYHLPWSAVGLRDFAIVRGLGLGCMLLLVAFAFNVLWSLLLYFLDLPGQTDLSPLFGSGFGGLLLALFTGGVIAPVAEEVFFRGFVFAGLYRQKGLWPAVVLSAMLFALVHITPTSWPPIFLLGVIFALLYEQTGSIWPAIAAHGAVNSLSFLAMYLLRALEALSR